MNLIKIHYLHVCKYHNEIYFLRTFKIYSPTTKVKMIILWGNAWFSDSYNIHVSKHHVVKHTYIQFICPLKLINLKTNQNHTACCVQLFPNVFTLMSWSQPTPVKSFGFLLIQQWFPFYEKISKIRKSIYCNSGITLSIFQSRWSKFPLANPFPLLWLSIQQFYSLLLVDWSCTALSWSLFFSSVFYECYLHKCFLITLDFIFLWTEMLVLIVENHRFKTFTTPTFLLGSC
jgi:hypothetical protein